MIVLGSCRTPKSNLYTLPFPPRAHRVASPVFLTLPVGTPHGNSSLQTRNLHGSTDPELQICYILPKSEYEIDKNNLRFVALAANPPTPGSSNIASATQMLDGLTLEETRRKWPQSFDQVKKEILRGNQAGIEDCLSKSDQVDAFLRGFDPDGNTALGLAAIAGEYDVVQLLLDFGAPINDSDQMGRTPLMWAALWGHFPIVRLLLDRGANKESQDNDGFTAIDLAKPWEQNEDKRHRHPVYKGWTKEASTERKIIVNYLRRDTLATLPPKQIGPEHIQHWFFKKVSPWVVQLFGVSMSYIELLKTDKAVAILHRGGRYPHMATISGFSPNVVFSDVEEILPKGPFWRNEAIRIANSLGHQFPRYNQETQPGQYFASHVEPKLIAYFISKHVFLPSELRQNEALRQLQQATPQSGMLTGATIWVNKEPCPECRLFTDTVNTALGLDIKLLNASTQSK